MEVICVLLRKKSSFSLIQNQQLFPAGCWHKQHNITPTTVCLRSLPKKHVRCEIFRHPPTTMTPVPTGIISKIPLVSSQAIVHDNVILDSAGNPTFSPPGPPLFCFRKDTSKIQGTTGQGEEVGHCCSQDGGLSEEEGKQEQKITNAFSRAETGTLKAATLCGQLAKIEAAAPPAKRAYS